jgi:general secretion pathway protein J
MRNIVAGKGRGFTLLELIIAIAIMSLLLTALYGTFSLAARAMLKQDDSLVKLQESRAFVDVLKREIESVLYSPDRSHCVFKMNDRDFYGRQASSLTMTTFTPVRKGLAKVTYSVEEREGSLVITKGIVSAFAQAPEENKIDLLEGIESFTLQAKYGDAWVKTWDSSLSRDAPKEVRITVSFRVNGKEGESPSVAPVSLFETAKLRAEKNL